MCIVEISNESGRTNPPRKRRHPEEADQRRHPGGFGIERHGFERGWYGGSNERGWVAVPSEAGWAASEAGSSEAAAASRSWFENSRGLVKRELCREGQGSRRPSLDHHNHATKSLAVPEARSTKPRTNFRRGGGSSRRIQRRPEAASQVLPASRGFRRVRIRDGSRDGRGEASCEDRGREAGVPASIVTTSLATPLA
jgi:hypothetical protein